MAGVVREKSCGVVVFRVAPPPRRYLLLHYPHGHWDYPKGHVEPGEDEQETALRELAEETGIRRVFLVPGFRRTIAYRFRERGRLVEKKVVFFLARAASERVTLSHEHQGFAWLPFQDARARLTHASARAVLEEAERFLLQSRGGRASLFERPGA